MQTQAARPRQARSIRNDALILGASQALLAEEGWGGLALARVAERAGLSVRPVRDRYPDRLALTAGIWERVIGPSWAASMGAVQAAASSGDAHALHTALRPFAKPSAVHRIAGELIMLAAHDDDVRTVIADQAIAPLAQLLNPRGSGGRAGAAIHGYAAMLAFGLLLESWRSDSARVDLTVPLADVAAAMGRPTEPRNLPTARAPHLDEGAVLDTGEPLWDSLLRATLHQVGTRGYEGATVEAIVAEAGCSQSVLFHRYATKREAFLDATRRMFGAATDLNVDYQARMAQKHSPGLAEAIMLREYMRPGRGVERVIGIEQYRLAWHDEQMRSALEAEQAAVRRSYREAHAELTAAQVRSKMHLDYAMGMGPVLLAQLLPDAWRLPYDVITVPLIDGHA